MSIVLKVARFLIKSIFGVSIVYLTAFVFCEMGGNGFPDTARSKDILQRRNFLVARLSPSPTPKDFFATDNIEFSGEWTLGTYSMAAAALTNIAMVSPKTARESSQIIARWIKTCLKKEVVLFDQQAWGENPLDEKVLQKDEGHIGYYGHLNIMLGCYALLNNDGRFAKLHQAISDAIARRMMKYPHRHIETYPGQNYPPDNTVSVASLRIADTVLGEQYAQLITEWVAQTKKLELPPYGLIPFTIDTRTGYPTQTFRGSNNTWNSFYLPLIDQRYAKEQYARLKKGMLRRLPGFAGVKEYDKGNLFMLERDAGPVLFGVSGSATAFMIAGARQSGDAALSKDLLRSIELLGCSATRGELRHYMVAPIVGDAIVLAMRTAIPWRPLWKETE